jgi:two-component system cell cycle sensor histidine kinase/response regulator CckA
VIAEEKKPALDIEQFTYQETPALRLKGQLDCGTVGQFVPSVEALARHGQPEVFLDLSHLKFIDSTSIGQIVKLHETLDTGGQKLVLLWAQAKLLEIFTVSGLRNHFDFRPDQRRAPRGEMQRTRERLLGSLRPCWDLYGCEEPGCPNYGENRFTCWTLPHAPCKSVQSDELIEEIAGCVHCVVFQNNIQALGEIQSHFTKYVTESEEAFRGVRSRADLLKSEVAARTKELATSEARYRDLFEEANDTLFDVEGPEASFVALNLEFERLTGLAREAWIGRSLFDLVSPVERDRLRERYRGALEGQRTGFELRLETSPGEERVVWCSLRPQPHAERDSRVRGALNDITQLVQVRQEQQRLYQAIQGISDYVIILDQAGRVVFVNEAFCNAWGYENKEEILGRLADEVETGLPPGHWEKVQQEVSRNGVWRGELMARRRNATEFPIEVYATPIYDEAGRARMMVGVSRDISQRKEMERALRESRQKYARLIEGAADAIVVFDKKREISQANKRACDFFGLSYGDLTRKRLDDLWPPKTTRSLADMLHVLSRTGRCLDQVAFVDGQGEPVEAEINATDLGNGDFVAILRDVSDRRRAEQENRIVRERFEAIFRSIVDGVLLVDEQGRGAIHNEQMAKLLDREPGELTGADAIALFEKISQGMVDSRDFREWVRSIASEPSSVARRELRLERPEKRFLRIYTGPVRSVRDSIVGRVWMLRDVTEQSRLEEELAQSQKMKSIGTLAGGVAHDFNNLLTGILGHASSLLRAIPPAHPHYRAIRAIDNSAQRAAELTQSLLAFSRRTETRMQLLRINDVVRASLRLLGHTLPKHIEIKAEMGPSLPTIRGDAMQLEQVVVNLCLNARDAMQEGGTLRLATRTSDIGDKPLPSGVESPDGQFVVLTVEDTGYGMSTETRERIFEPFYTTKDPGEGTGLGLSLAYGILRSHSGFIEVTSAPGEGARFDLYFPAVGARPKKAVEAREPQPGGGRGELILLVDDEPVVREVAQTVLEQLGYRALTAEGGHEALEIYKERGPEIDLVLLDLMMPRMRGEQVFRLLREINPDLRIVISTGNPELLDRLPDLQTHAAGFANKPYRVSDLGKSLREALEKEAPLERLPEDMSDIFTQSSHDELH